MSALVERAAELRHAASEATGATWREVTSQTEGPRKRKAASAAALEADLKLQAAAIAYVAELARNVPARAYAITAAGGRPRSSVTGLTCDEIAALPPCVDKGVIADAE